MTADALKQIIRADIKRDHIIDHIDMRRAGRKLAGESTLAMGLEGRPALQISGIAAYKLLEKDLPGVLTAQDAIVHEQGTFPGTGLRNYQLLGQYNRVVLGSASIVDDGELPKPNLTRKHGATVNARYGSVAYLPGMEPEAPSEDVIFALILTCRDKNDPAKLRSVFIGALEPDCSGFIFIEPIDDFVTGYDTETYDGSSTAEPAPLAIAIKLGVKPFVGGETGEGEESVASDNKSP